MAAEAARVLDYDSRYYYGSAAPVLEPFPEVAPPLENPYTEERRRQRERTKVADAVQSLPHLSFFAIVGSFTVAAIMILVVLAQISYNEAATEAVRLKSQFSALEEQQRALMIEFESVMDMKEVERYARDVLGMSRPEVGQLAVYANTAVDRAEVLASPEKSTLRDFGSFISSLLDYFRG